ncbi:MAG TPA: AAA family ATPase [Polyangiaceae bacterium]|nr:AAA family ATPase [Polyangiaceae bacterium]
MTSEAAATVGASGDKPPPPHDVRGEVISFYSYKGGVGRSMAVANVAVLLAQAGKRLLVLDLDFEAPGLHRYFSTGTRWAHRPGMIELMHRFRERLDGSLEMEAAEGARVAESSASQAEALRRSVER